MAAHKIYIDRLELAYERNSTFENELQVCQDQWNEDPSYGWAIDVEGELNPVAPPSFDELLKGDYQPYITGGFSLDNTVTIGDWSFVRGSFPGPNTAYKYNYRVECKDFGVLGHIYFETYLLRRDKIYLRLANHVLYDESYWQLVKRFENDFQLHFMHVSKVDIALDSMVDTSKVIYDLMRRDKSIEWVVNGHRITNRNATVKKLFWVVSGSINTPDANKTLYITQTEGLQLCSYDKTAEIADKSAKYYQTGDWDVEDEGVNIDNTIYRNETRLSRKDVLNYTQSHHMDDTQFRANLQHLETRLEMFRHLSRKLLRWNKEGRSHDITTLVIMGNVKKGLLG